MLNEVKTLFNDTYESKKQELEEALINKKLESEKVDVTLPETDITIAPAHMVERVIEDLEEFFISMGYQVVEGPEVEKDLYNFELLNLPKGQPARDAQDTFYIKNDEYGRALAFNNSEENLIQFAENLQRQSMPTENIVIVTVQPNRFLLI